MAAAVAVIALPPLIIHRLSAVWSGPYRRGLITGPVVASLSKSVRTVFAPKSSADEKRQLMLQVLLAAAALVFAAAIAMLAGNVVAWVIAFVLVPDMSTVVAYAELTGAAIMLAVVMGAVTWAFNHLVNLNRFSMHAVYRNRLVRGFLGSARPGQRKPDRYTQFDPSDNLRLSDTWSAKKPRCLFPVINVALNTTVGQDTAKAERRASSFTMTPLRCGSSDLPKSEETEAVSRKGAYILTECYAGGERETGPGDKEHGARSARQ